MSRKYTVIFMLVLSLLSATGARALSFNLDSIAEWGKFPRFVVNTYRWGDTFFNGYDTTFVKSTGYKFNAKLTTESWADGYSFLLPNDKYIYMLSEPSTSAGVYLTYVFRGTFEGDEDRSGEGQCYGWNGNVQR